MTNRGLLVRMHARHGKEGAVEELLHSAAPMVQDESDTVAWFAVRFGRSDYGVFGVFPTDAALDAHLDGPVAAALKQRGAELFEAEPRIQKVEVLADKLPVASTYPDTKGLLLTFKAKSNHEADVEQFFRYAHDVVNNEHNTTAWFAMRTEDGSYGIFDVFPSNEDRFMHLVGPVPRELAKQAFTLMGSMPDVELLTVQAEKIGSDIHQIRRH